MRRIVPFLGLNALLALAAAPGAAIPFAQADSDLRPDAAARFGTLPNGLRYVVMANGEPKGRASLRLVVLAGSFQEAEAQRGLAHFLEHMAFDGSTHYPPGALNERLRSLGMDVGADTDASTSFERTLYQVDLPDAAPATLAEGLGILADYGGGLLLDPAMIEKERGIVMGERRATDTVAYRTLAAQFGLMAAGTRLADRMPIGLDSVIEKSGREALAAFYDTWYRPELMAVVVVGDVDPAAVEKQIGDGFSAMAPRSPQAPAVDLGAVPDFKGVQTLYHSEPQAQATDVVIACTVPYSHQPDTATYRVGLLPRTLAVRMLNKRLTVLSKGENAPFIRASSAVQEVYNLFRQASIDVVCRPGQWTAALGVADQELRRALVAGFRPDELRDAVADVRNELVQAAQAAPGRRSGDLAGEIANSLVERRVYTNPADDLAMYGPALAKVTPADCASALQAAWRSPGRYVLVAGNTVIGGDANASIASAYTNSLGVVVTQAGARAVTDWAYADFGPPGAVASRKYVDDLDFTEITFANGVRLNLKRTEFESDSIRIAARLGSGQLTEPASTEPGLSTFTGLTFTAGGLRRHSAADLRRILAGRKVGVRFSSTLDAFTLTGDTNREDLALEFQLLAAYLADPGYRPDTVVDARKRIDVEYVRLEHTVRGPLALQVPKLLFSNDPRFGLPPKAAMMARDLDEEKAWLAPTLSGGALEVSLAGDFGVEEAIEAAARTIGTLPRRDPRPPLDDLRRVSFPSQPFAKDIPVETADAKSLVAAYWPTSDGMDVHRARRLGVLASVLSGRLREKVREQLGNTYTPSVASSASDVFPGFGYIVAILEVDPARAKDIEKLMVSVAGDLGARATAEEEIARTRDQLVTSILETERTNQYWMTVLGRAQEKPEVLDWARTRRSDFESITKADIDSLARSYLAPERVSRVIVHPAIAQPGRTTIVVPPPDAM